MLTSGLVLAAVAAAIHVYIFFLESIAWTGDKARALFGIATLEEAKTMQLLALNQGFYNLFLAVETLLGILSFALGSSTVGATLVLAGTGSMVAASLVLLISSPDKAAAALKQGLVPLLGILALVVGLVR